MTDDKVNQSRRGFLTAKLFSREGRETVVRKQLRSGLVPPGLQPAVSKNSCANCAGYCVQSCPQQIIKLHANDHDYRGQPYLDFTNNGCTFCNKCSLACPHVDNSEINPPKPAVGKAILNEKACYAWLNIICMSCVRACEYDLIKFNEEKKPAIFLDDCTGCGFCIKTCPASAIKIVA